MSDMLIVGIIGAVAWLLSRGSSTNSPAPQFGDTVKLQTMPDGRVVEQTLRFPEGRPGPAPGTRWQDQTADAPGFLQTLLYPGGRPGPAPGTRIQHTDAGDVVQTLGFPGGRPDVPAGGKYQEINGEYVWQPYGRGAGAEVLALGALTGAAAAMLGAPGLPAPVIGQRKPPRFLGPPTPLHAPEPVRFHDSPVGAPTSAGPKPVRHPMPWDTTPPRPVTAPAPATNPHRPLPFSPGLNPGGHIPPPELPAPSVQQAVGKVIAWEHEIGAPRRIEPGAIAEGAFHANPIIGAGPTVAPPSPASPLHPVLQIGLNYARKIAGGPIRLPDVNPTAPRLPGRYAPGAIPPGTHLM